MGHKAEHTASHSPGDGILLDPSFSVLLLMQSTAGVPLVLGNSWVANPAPAAVTEAKVKPTASTSILSMSQKMY